MARKVLAISGGGIRGLIPALILAAIERRTGRRAAEMFDLIAGTSTGAILAAGLVSPRLHWSWEMAALYTDLGRTIFSGRRAMFRRLHLSKWPSRGLHLVLQETLGTAQMHAATTNVMMTSFDLVHNRFKVWKSWDVPDRAIPLWQVAAASASAPTYFKAMEIGTRCFVDGGVAANDPTMVAFAEAKRLWPQEYVMVLSLGTGRSDPLGACGGGGGLLAIGPQIPGIVGDAQADVMDYFARFLIPEGMRHKIDVALPAEHTAMDDASRSNLNALEAITARWIDENEDELNEVTAWLEGKSDSDR